MRPPAPQPATAERPGVVVLTEVFPPARGGSGRWFWELYRRLSGFDVTVVTTPAADARDFDAAAPIRIERTHDKFASWGILGVRAAREYIRAVRRIRRVKSQRDADVIHCGKALPEGLVGYLQRLAGGPPYWCYAHGEELTLAKTSRELKWWTARVLRGAAHIVANSQHTRRMLEHDWRLAPHRITVISPGVDASRFVPADDDPDVRQRLGWAGRRVILTVGALQKRKGQDMMLRALPAIRRACPDVLYVMAGEGWEREYLEGIVGELALHDSVSFLGSPSEDALLRCYQQCDLFALPNRQVGWDFEGFGIVLLEAQACGKPVVTGMSGGTVETIVPGETGEIVSCDEPTALADVCAALLTNAARRQELGAKGRARIVETFDWGVLARRADALFRTGLRAERND